jgi:hypothetical protein
VCGIIIPQRPSQLGEGQMSLAANRAGLSTPSE